MQARTLFLAAFAALLVSPTPARTAELALDLAGGGATFVVTPDEESKVTLVNRLLDPRYTIEVRRVGSLLSAFSAGSLAQPQVGAEADSERAREQAERCRGILERLGRVQDESLLPGALFEAKADTLGFPGCRTLVDEFEESTTQVLLDPVVVASGEAVMVDVCRPARPGETEARCWKFTIESGESRRWLTHYGFSFLPDRDERFFTDEDEEMDGFVIRARRDADDDELEYEPTISFTYVPDTIAERSAWQPLFAAGLGLDVIDDPVVFAGLAWVVGDNVNLFLGAAVHEQQRLDGRYARDQVLPAALEEDQLHETKFVVNGIVGIGFRFDGNPFAKKGDESKTSVEPAGSSNEVEDEEGPADDWIPGGEPQPEDDPQEREGEDAPSPESEGQR